MNKKQIFAILFILLFSSCHFADQPAEKHDFNEKLSVAPPISELSAKWVADSNTYKLLHKKGTYKIDSLYLVLRKDNTFEIINYPNIAGGAFADTGKWAIGSSYKSTATIDFMFMPGGLFPKGFNDSFFLYKKNAKLELLKYIGDPDSGEYLMFVKL
jgi:hypothetical protein